MNIKPTISKRLAKKIASLKGNLLIKGGNVIEDSRHTRYATSQTGAVIRLSERPWHGKYERRQVIKMRRSLSKPTP